mmetsp:Transcript_3257/g.5932  ORF Transcript_3257/g.5932 Transcript_3257/m.5932 type:complete len:193 (-) Transcript_3257:541-1119(-)
MAFHDDSAAAAASLAEGEEEDDFFGDQEDDETFDSPHVGMNDRVARIENPQQATSRPTTSSSTTTGLAMRDAKATEEQMRNIGYLEAYEDSKELRLQAGFEAGYRETVEAAMRIGQRLGEVVVVMPMNPTTEPSTNTIMREDPIKSQAKATQVGTFVRAFLEEQQTKGGDSAEHLPGDIHALETQLVDVLDR